MKNFKEYIICLETKDIPINKIDELMNNIRKNCVVSWKTDVVTTFGEHLIKFYELTNDSLYNIKSTIGYLTETAISIFAHRFKDLLLFANFKIGRLTEKRLANISEDNVMYIMNKIGEIVKDLKKLK